MHKELAGLMFVLLCATSALGKDPEIERMIATYNANEARFHAQYRAQEFSAAGTVVSITTDVLGVGFAYFVRIDVDGSRVRCDTNNRDIAASFDKGQRVRFTGRIYDVTLGVLRISDCKFETPAAALERQQKLESQRRQQNLERQGRANKIRSDKNLMTELRKLGPLREVLDEMIEENPDSVNSVEAAKQWEMKLRADLTGDGIPDYVFVSSTACGTGSCAMYIFVSQRGRYVLSYKGEGSADVGISVKRTAPPTIEYSVHWSSCNYVLPCVAGIRWDGREFRHLQ
jgi:hypothetical protein